MISDKDFFGFKWPPKGMPYPFKKSDANITWMAYVYPNSTMITTDSLPNAKFGFDTEPQARKWKRDTEASKSKPLVIVAPIYGTDEEGFIV